MIDDLLRLLDLGLLLGKLSLIPGGGTASLGEMQQEFVGRGWITPQQFLDAYAVGQITPGPGVAFVVPLGYQTAGVAGAIVALLSYFVPAGVLALVVAHNWGRIRTSPWPTAFRTAMVPVAAGLTLGSAYTMVASGMGDVGSLLIAAGALLVLLRTHLPTPLVLAGGGATGLAFLLVPLVPGL